MLTHRKRLAYTPFGYNAPKDLRQDENTTGVKTKPFNTFFNKLFRKLLPGHAYQRIVRKQNWRHLLPPAGRGLPGSHDRLEPVSREFGFDRGRCIDRYYIESFLLENRRHIRGRVLEAGDRNYTEKFGEAPEIYCDTTYDAVYAAAEAIKAAGSYDGEAIRSALADLSFTGASGPISFDSKGDRASGTFELWEVVKDASTETGYKNVGIELVTLEK